ncbi:uncharacterized protein NDAI_0D02560 [Naumovozyma dairenensis CBS 421]|uniref:BRCT domain-containing protein n=1 Tax=Naumovozyma dairenensis (strain ATCC 10597 / BCRC 20456 / CBS 421 / NBRC 0211 / NRRL Y-12639) TaxID=1071378 RepID=G0W9V9_NAUDC|nr:hypothetical protein NDAI_0D02560 [Naumovozyma dairenensis CBS 421]CCD24570.1 hypothetical protein NDAI_0D02560 [Naumovozyma dairenensis CBS 421]
MERSALENLNILFIDVDFDLDFGPNDSTTYASENKPRWYEESISNLPRSHYHVLNSDDIPVLWPEFTFNDWKKWFLEKFNHHQEEIHIIVSNTINLPFYKMVTYDLMIPVVSIYWLEQVLARSSALDNANTNNTKLFLKFNNFSPSDGNQLLPFKDEIFYISKSSVTKLEYIFYSKLIQYMGGTMTDLLSTSVTKIVTNDPNDMVCTTINSMEYHDDHKNITLFKEKSNIMFILPCYIIYIFQKIILFQDHNDDNSNDTIPIEEFKLNSNEDDFKKSLVKSNNLWKQILKLKKNTTSGDGKKSQIFKNLYVTVSKSMSKDFNINLQKFITKLIRYHYGKITTKLTDPRTDTLITSTAMDPTYKDCLSTNAKNKCNFIGTPFWILDMHYQATFRSPLENIFWSPIKHLSSSSSSSLKKKNTRFNISYTGFFGLQRLYIHNLILLLNANPMPQLSTKLTTHLISKFDPIETHDNNKKLKIATARGIKIVSSFWLEDSYVKNNGQLIDESQISKYQEFHSKRVLAQIHMNETTYLLSASINDKDEGKNTNNDDGMQTEIQGILQSINENNEVYSMAENIVKESNVVASVIDKEKETDIEIDDDSLEKLRAVEPITKDANDDGLQTGRVAKFRYEGEKDNSKKQERIVESINEEQQVAEQEHDRINEDEDIIITQELLAPLIEHDEMAVNVHVDVSRQLNIQDGELEVISSSQDSHSNDVISNKVIEGKNETEEQDDQSNDDTNRSHSHSNIVTSSPPNAAVDKPVSNNIMSTNKLKKPSPSTKNELVVNTSLEVETTPPMDDNDNSSTTTPIYSMSYPIHDERKDERDKASTISESVKNIFTETPIPTLAPLTSKDDSNHENSSITDNIVGRQEEMDDKYPIEMENAHITEQEAKWNRLKRTYSISKGKEGNEFEDSDRSMTKRTKKIKSDKKNSEFEDDSEIDRYLFDHLSKAAFLHLPLYDIDAIPTNCLEDITPFETKVLNRLGIRIYFTINSENMNTLNGIIAPKKSRTIKFLKSYSFQPLRYLLLPNFIYDVLKALRQGKRKDDKKNHHYNKLIEPSGVINGDESDSNNLNVEFVDKYFIPNLDIPAQKIYEMTQLKGKLFERYGITNANIFQDITGGVETISSILRSHGIRHINVLKKNTNFAKSDLMRNVQESNNGSIDMLRLNPRTYGENDEPKEQVNVEYLLIAQKSSQIKAFKRVMTKSQSGTDYNGDGNNNMKDAAQESENDRQHVNEASQNASSEDAMATIKMTRVSMAVDWNWCVNSIFSLSCDFKPDNPHVLYALRSPDEPIN